MTYKIKLLSPAKINLSLQITGKNDKNYHLLNSLVVFGVEYDQIIFSEHDENEVEFTGLFSKQVTNNSIMEKTLKLLDEKGLKKKFRIEIEKNIPIGAGLGGGSGNAGVFLNAISNIYSINFTNSEMTAIGADVPMCKNNDSKLVQGIGERVELIDIKNKLYILLINPGLNFETKLLYSLVKSYSEIYDNKQQIDKNLIAYLKSTGNDFLNVEYNELNQVKEIIEKIGNSEGCLYSSMSGSGSTCFGIFENYEGLQKSFLYFTKIFPYYWVKMGIV